MSGWLYLIRNRDLYKIGITRNFKNRMRQLKPDNVVLKLYTTNFVQLETELHKRYKKFRIPQTEYFRLKKSHLKEIKERISNLDYPISITLGLILKSLLSIASISFLIFILMALNINNINIVIIKTFVWMEKILIGLSFLSLFVHSGMYLSFWNELKYRISKLIVFIICSLFFRIGIVFLQ